MKSVTIEDESTIRLPFVTRLEVIGRDGRQVVEYGVQVYAQLQDDGRTLKVFWNEQPS